LHYKSEEIICDALANWKKYSQNPCCSANDPGNPMGPHWRGFTRKHWCRDYLRKPIRLYIL